MSFGGGGFGAFGSTNNTSSAFGGSGGGFGASNTNTGFGATNTTPAPFGQSTNTGGSLFGGGGTGTSTFGGGGAFGSSNTGSTFGSKPFGSTTTGTTSLFGGGGTTGGSGFGGGFGASTTTTPAAGGFGAANTGGGIFGQNKPGFGTTSTGTGTGGLFGGSTAGGAFGSGATGGFGATNTAFGGAAAPPGPNNGTANVAFNAHIEKDNTGTQSYQTITMMDPYKNYSLEELRLADYNQGRRFGPQSGFGQNSGFGGFPQTAAPAPTGFGASTNTGGGLFGGGGGGGNTTSTPFGQSTTPSAFGANTANTGGGLFGQKPAGGSLFGGSTTTPATGGSGLFGSTNTATNTGFGANTGTGFGSSTGGGLFGQNNQTQNKPAFGAGFGSTNTGTTTTPFGGGAPNAFGSTANTGGGLFGSQNQTSTTPSFGASNTNANTGGGLFGGGGAATAGTTGGGLFGNTQNQTQPQPSGGLFGGGFGQNNQQNQAKPGGLFGTSTTTPAPSGGGLFGNTQPQQPSGGGLFGQSTQTQPQNTGGGLFGNKPAAGGLFGSTATQNTGGTTGGGLFGGLSNANQPNQGSTLFGGSAQQKPGGLFGGSTTNTNTGGGLFGQSQNTAAPLGGSLFGNQSQQQQPQQPSMNNSLFGASGGGQLLNTSMMQNPYGSEQLFANLATSTASPGPLATPLSSSQKNRKSAILPQHKLNPTASTRLLTPQQKRPGAYGFSYSTYGTPAGSVNSTPGMSASLFGGVNRALGKSLSTNNLRVMTPDTSILNPLAFSSTGRPYAAGSLKKLNINRAINARSPLFDESSPEKKRVSFASPSTNGETEAETNGDVAPKGNELVLRRDSEESTTPEASPEKPVEAVNGNAKQPEMTQVNGTGSSSAPESRHLGPRPSAAAIQNGTVPDPTPGEYYSRPSLDSLRQMSRSELSQVQDFVVGRDKIGEIQFNPGKTVDLTGVDFDKLFGDIVQLNIRNATVYGETTTVPKPARGMGLNVPSRISLANSWPRNRAGKKDQKHLERLHRVHGTNFETYHAQTGEWIFTVPHFSTYALDYDGELYDDDDESELSDAPETPAQFRSGGTPQGIDSGSPNQSSPDDTFDFKNRSLNRSVKRASVPGGFGNQVAYEEDESMETGDEQSFLGERSVGSLDGQYDAEYTEESESESVEDQDMAGPVSAPTHTTEHPTAVSNMPKSILKQSTVLVSGLGTPSKGRLDFDDDWANQLQRTISPKKQDRRALREYQDDALRDQDINLNMPKFGQSTNNSIFTRAGLMESLFGETESRKESLAKKAPTGIEYPYPKRPKTSSDLDELSEQDRQFHSCNKPHFGESGVLVYASKGSSSLEDGLYPTYKQPIALASGEIRFTKLPTFADAAPETLNLQKKRTVVRLENGVPCAKIESVDAPLDFADVAKTVAIDTPAGVQEQHAWQLLSILFDEVDEVPSDMTPEQFNECRDRYRKDKLSEFWETLVYRDAEKHVQQAETSEEKAIAYLTAHNIPEACHTLLTGLDMRLATMVAQIGGDAELREDMRSQIEDWRRHDVLSEMENAVRALYELVSGNCARSEGKQLHGRENNAKTFSIAQEFGLDWRRAFGLRLWYGIMAHEPIELAIAQFGDALRDGLEEVKPTPWFQNAAEGLGWNDPQAENREDLLWGILKLYASSKLEFSANVEEVLAPENVSGHPFNARLSFQLFQLFKSRYEDDNEDFDRKVAMPTVRSTGSFNRSFLSTMSSSEEGQSETPLIELGDKITLTYAASLHTPEHWTTAVFVYTHLSSPAMREHYIRSLLTSFSKTFSVAESDATYAYLVEQLHIPVQWIHAAAALQAKVDGDDLRQTLHLIKAGELEEAHEVLCRSVGPESIISRDYEALHKLLAEFMPSDGRHHHRDPVQGWSRGGQIYLNYLTLLERTSHVSNYRVDENLDEEIRKLLSKLQTSLESVARDRMETCALEERVALTEIASAVATHLSKMKHTERSRVLKLPLTEDLWLRHTSELSLNYYRAVMESVK